MRLEGDPHDNWDLDEPADEGTRAAKHRLVAEVKRLVDRVALLDANDLDAAAVDELTAQVTTAADAVSALPTLEKTGLAKATTPDHVLSERSPFSGRSNPLAPPMTITVDGPVTRATATYTAAYEGPPDTLHGGFVAAAFDDLLGVAQMASGQAGFTGTLTVKMLRPTPLHTPITYEAGVHDVQGRKIICRGTAFAGGELVAEAEGLFITSKERFPG